HLVSVVIPYNSFKLAYLMGNKTLPLTPVVNALSFQNPIAALAQGDLIELLDKIRQVTADFI
ncbi:hypothetical protein, partial [Enterobacter intestinihominis]